MANWLQTDSQQRTLCFAQNVKWLNSSVSMQTTNSSAPNVNTSYSLWWGLSTELTDVYPGPQTATAISTESKPTAFNATLWLGSATAKRGSPGSNATSALTSFGTFKHSLVRSLGEPSDSLTPHTHDVCFHFFSDNPTSNGCQRGWPFPVVHLNTYNLQKKITLFTACKCNRIGSVSEDCDRVSGK